MDAAPEPFLLLEPEPAPRLEAVPALLPTAEPVRWLRSPTLAGAAIFGIGIPVLWALWLVSALFDRWGTLGWAGLVILAALCGRPWTWQVLFVLPEPSCSATDERRQSRPKPFGRSTAWSSST